MPIFEIKRSARKLGTFILLRTRLRIEAIAMRKSTIPVIRMVWASMGYRSAIFRLR